MTDAKRRGRPKKQADSIDKAAVLRCAHTIMTTQGLENVTFRTLALQLGVTPMAARYHVGNRDQMLSDLAAEIFAGLDAGVSNETPIDGLRQLFMRYGDLALQNADLVRFLLSKPDCMPSVLSRFTSQVRLKTQALNHGDADDVLLNLLIDFIHGFVFAADATSHDNTLTLTDCMRSIDWVLSAAKSKS